MNNFDLEIKCSDQILKAIAKINGDTLTVSSSAGNSAGHHRQ